MKKFLLIIWVIIWEYLVPVFIVFCYIKIINAPCEQYIISLLIILFFLTLYSIDIIAYFEVITKDKKSNIKNFILNIYKIIFLLIICNKQLLRYLSSIVNCLFD